MKLTELMPIVMIVVLIFLVLLVFRPMAGFTLEYWISFAKGEVWESPFWIDTICGIFVPIVVPAWIITHICKAADLPANHPKYAN